MKIIIQRVKSANVTVNNKQINSINQGVLVFLGIHKNDTSVQSDYIIKKLLTFKIFSETNKKFELNIETIQGEILIVSQFTLYGSLKKGTKPSFTNAMPPKQAEIVYNEFIDNLKSKTNLNIKTGKFGAYMKVSLINDGPATFILENNNITN